MSIWLVPQVAFALFAWSMAARPVLRLAHVAGLLDAGLAATVAELRRAGRGRELAAFVERLGVPAFDTLFALDPDAVSADELVDAARTVVRDLTPPSRLLRGLASAGTTLGLLAAGATLVHAMNGAGSSGAIMQQGASRAFDCAVAGFVTAMPCWTAVGLAGRTLRTVQAGIDRVLFALRAEAPAVPAGLDGSESPL